MKAEWAFKVYDYDCDNQLGPEDIKKTVQAMTNVSGKTLTDVEISKVVKNVFDETDVDQSRLISLTEFKQLVKKSSYLG